MSDKYLWDRSGEPDEQVAELESTLGELRYDEPLQAVTAAEPARPWLAIAAAAVVVLGLGIGAFYAFGGGEPATIAETSEPDAAPGDEPDNVACTSAGSPDQPWTVTPLSGQPSCDDEAIGQHVTLAAGGRIETDASSTAEIVVADIGRVVLEANSRLELKATSESEHRLQLDRGRLYAQIDAPPRLFLVQTPAALAVDLGCEYTLEVADDGATHLHVTFGYVSLEDGGDEVYVPAGFMADALPKIGPTAPYPQDAPKALRDAVATLAREPAPAAMDAVRAAARRSGDTLTLWHLLRDEDAAQCRATVARLEKISKRKAPGNLECGDPGLRDAWRTALEPLWQPGAVDPEPAKSPRNNKQRNNKGTKQPPNKRAPQPTKGKPTKGKPTKGKWKGKTRRKGDPQ